MRRRTVTSYAEALAVLGKRESKMLAHNTKLHRRDDGIAVRFHATDVVLYRPDGSVSLFSGGWHTVTTKARLNTFSPFRVWQKDFDWYCSDRLAGWKKYEFKDGITMRPDGSIDGVEARGMK